MTSAEGKMPADDHDGRRNGEEWLHDLLEENRSGFQKCFENHVTCGGYDALLYPTSFESVKDIEAFIDE